MSGQDGLRLDWLIHPVTSLAFGPSTRLEGEHLVIDREALRSELLAADERLAGVELALAHPGERVRVSHVVDAVEPRCKEDGSYFAGRTAPLALAGDGPTHVLRGAAVLLSQPLPAAEDGIVDMAGPLATLSKFAATCNLVVLPRPQAGLSAAEQGHAAVDAGLRAAVHLARAARGLPLSAVESFSLGPASPDLPRVGYICYLYSHGDGRERLLYGQTTRDLLPPAPVHPNEVLDGAIVHSGYTMPSKSVTYNHQNNGVLRELLARHGGDLAFAGACVCNHHARYENKERTAFGAAKLMRHVLGAEAVVVTKDGGGQADVDLMLCCRWCEEAGLRTVLLVKEEAGADGSGFALADISPLADAIVTTGNGTERMVVGFRPERVIGEPRFKDGQDAASDQLDISFNHIVGAVDFEGDIRICSVEV